ncbi:TIGR03619 family F420-dependent LLM class oxidoreductase [Rhodococcus sp. NPDC056960]|uniref:TIGR03619 family F420-dependent LLM class oxidoreductase n=1 Tax=Rhodococcus sp. NPDC056960 TaxID=3345982 RepID=UPI003642453E
MSSVGLSAYGMTGTDLVELAECADKLGFDALWLGEHVLRPLTQNSSHPSNGTTQHHAGPLVDEDTELTDPWVVHAMIAAVTTRIKLGTAVYVLPLRHPLQTARTTITVQEVSGGRVLFGVGAGWLEEEFDALGIPFRTRVSRTEECIEILRKAWSGKPFSHEGKHFRFESVQLHLRSVDVPVILGGNGPQAVARAARLGDGWFTSGTPSFDESLRLVREIGRLRDDAGKAGPFKCYVRVATTAPDELERYRDHGMSDLVIWADAFWEGRTLDERRDRLAALAERMGVTPVPAQ